MDTSERRPSPETSSKLLISSSSRPFFVLVVEFCCRSVRRVFLCAYVLVSVCGCFRACFRAPIVSLCPQAPVTFLQHLFRSRWPFPSILLVPGVFLARAPHFQVVVATIAFGMGIGE